ncbi:uncharacterized protein Z518_03463 [Rhinocladiella mackenziei CBS 650.93]|uniref:Major facilitator superfamily (MFS) profile domain-containing protein n=1 Tax=Rhinocladiella mackenziei CBS 650.93 TaxID=1442369 RepID=A0A0D2IZE9_9EURO|nr:uncharacterized protein Z518_03463 [Rhinocladiella mackenziei CBS 650.93]KIX08806.1 hypothetical protein Z518_03463 [Rhinocladiella mackenziei CBS 650.93]
MTTENSLRPPEKASPTAQPVEPVESIDTIAAAFKAAPGTEILYDQEGERGSVSQRLHKLQHVRHGDGHILLVPQPSLTDPNDPLRWSTLKKWAAFGNGLYYAFLGSVTGPIMAAWLVTGAASLDVPLRNMAYATGATLICQGVANTLWMPFAIKYGRRPVYLLSTFLMGLACVWLGVASQKSYLSLLLARAFLGAWEAPIESIVPSTITDIFFLHDRGSKVAMYGLSVLGGNELGPVLSAFMIQALGMDWAYYIVAIFIGINVLTMFFFMPETRFLGSRPSILTDVTESSGVKEGAYHLEVHEDEEHLAPKKRTFVQALAFWGQGDPEVSLWRAFLRPFVLLAYPTVVWACFIYGMALSWNVLLAVLTGQLFSPPPYSFDSESQGLVFLSPLVGSLIGTYLCGPMADSIANYYTRRNHGIREPEMRLPTCIVAAALTFFGALMAGLCFTHQTHWAGPVVGIGVLSTGAQMGATLGMNYALDCHKELSVELMVTVASLKSAIAWIWTWVANDWLTDDGPLVVFLSIGAVSVVVYLSTIVFYLRGKAIRTWLLEKDILKLLGL